MSKIAVSIMVGCDEAEEGKNDSKASGAVAFENSSAAAVRQALSDANRALELGADVVEFRVDPLMQKAVCNGAVDSAVGSVIDIVENAPLPCIVTCRLSEEGGLFESGNDDKSLRTVLLRQMAQDRCYPAYIDLELAAWQRSSALRQATRELVSGDDTQLILSAHDFKKCPENLDEIVKVMATDNDCQIIKLAWQAESLADNIRAFEIIQSQVKPVIAVCMGEFALPSRVLAGKFGAFLTFACLDDQSATAPGQPAVTALKEEYHFDKINSKTKVFGVIGCPVGHSLSPAIHNAGLTKAGIDGVYLPLMIPPEYESFEAALGALVDCAELDFTGASVTIPHKKNLLTFVQQRNGEIEPLAKSIGAANTLSRLPDGRLYASNTDYGAALDSVCLAMDISRRQLAGQRVAVLGAGGVARAVVAGFAHYQAKVTIYNRTFENAAALAEAFDRVSSPVTAQSWEQRYEVLEESQGDNQGSQIIINCTPIGMTPDMENSPLDMTGNNIFNEAKVVFDTIYTPTRTRLIEAAASAGFTTVLGEQMFLRQAAKQFEKWTDQPAPFETFKKTLHKSLARR